MKNRLYIKIHTNNIKTKYSFERICLRLKIGPRILGSGVAFTEYLSYVMKIN